MFDLTRGFSSDHSEQTFATDIAYTLYIKVHSNSRDITLNEGEDWSGAGNLGSDDQVILVGNGEPIIGRKGNAIVLSSADSSTDVGTLNFRWGTGAFQAAVRVQYL